MYNGPMSNMLEASFKSLFSHIDPAMQPAIVTMPVCQTLAFCSKCMYQSPRYILSDPFGASAYGPTLLCGCYICNIIFSSNVGLQSINAKSTSCICSLASPWTTLLWSLGGRKQNLHLRNLLLQRLKTIPFGSSRCNEKLKTQFHHKS